MAGLFCIINFSHFSSAYKNPKQLFKKKKNSKPPLFLLINNTCRLEGLSDLTTKKLTGNPDDFKCQNRLAANDERRLHNLWKHCVRLLQASRGASSSLRSCHDITSGLWVWAQRQLKLRFGPWPKIDIMCLNGSQMRWDWICLRCIFLWWIPKDVGDSLVFFWHRHSYLFSSPSLLIKKYLVVMM